MAKHCDVCNQEYPDDLPACPHCASVKKTHLAGGHGEDRKTQLADINPAELADEPALDRMKMDSPSDAEPQAHGETPPTEAAPAGEIHAAHGVDMATLLPPEAAPPEDIGATLPAAPPEELVGELHAEHEPVHASPPLGEEAEMIDLTAAPSEPVATPSDSAVDLGGPPFELVEEGSGAVVEEKPPSGGSEVFVAELASDASHVDLVGDSGVNLAEGETKGPSSRDLIAEAVESGMDQNASDAELAEEAALDASLVEEHSSAVDLGSHEDIPTPPEGAAAEAAVVADAPVEGEKGSPSVPSAGEGNWSLMLESSLRPTPPKGEVPADEAAAHAEDEAVVAESEVDNLLADLERESATGGAVEAVTEEEVFVSAESAVSAGEEAVSVEEASVSAEVEGEPAAVSEAEVDDLLAGLEQEPAAGDSALSALVDEEAIGEAAAEEEPVVAAEEGEEEKPAKPVKPRSRIPALAGGTFLGLLLGAGGLIGARFAGIDVPSMIGAGEKKPSGPAVPQVKAPTFEERAAHVRRGDWDEADKAGIERIQEDKPDELAARGDYRLGIYLQKSGSKVNLQDPPLQQAIADLQKAAEAKPPNLDAIYDLGLINELAKEFTKASDEYKKGVTAAGADADQKQRFESALDRVELKASGNPVPAALLLPERAEDRAALLALLLIGFQPPPQPQAGGKEAGTDFWKALKQARAGDAAGAVKAIEDARKLHDSRRFTRLRKAQNPLSDPTEDIFLRCCDELEHYWKLQAQLRPKYLTNKNTPVQAVQTLLKEAGDNAATVEKISTKLVEEKIIKAGEDVPAGVESLIADKKKADANVVDLTTKLKTAEDDAKKEAVKSAAKLKMIEEDRDTKLKAAADRETKLKASNDDLNMTLKKIADDLAAAKFLDPKDKPDIGAAVHKAVEIAKMKDPQGTISLQQSQIAQLKASLKERWQPAEMLPLWRLMLDQNRGRPELTKQAQKDVDRVQADPMATPVQKGQAEVVLGLALRNNEKYDEAKTVLEKARSTVDRGDWLLSADAAFKEASDPVAYYAADAQRLYDAGQLDAAVKVLAHAVEILQGKDNARLFAQKSLMELDAARSKAKGPLKDKDIRAAKEDAANAVKAKLPAGYYAEGRIAEELGQWDAAADSYRKAKDAHPALDAEGSLYRISLARVLLQAREPRPGQLPPPAADKVGWRDPAPYPARAWQEMKVFALMVVLGLQAPPLPGEEPNLEEAQKLADEILKAPANTVPFNVRAQALAIKGRWTLALQIYVAGVRPMMPREYGRELEYLVRNHPRLKRPDSLRVPDPAEGERHFAAGLNFYFGRDYANAEKECLLAVENYSQDARYFYYLGLSRLALSKRRDALADFDEGAVLERLNRPAPAAVSESLERIQGPLRRIVNEIRTRPLER
jgi:hypothetical protein